MEESQKQIIIRSNISSDLLLNIENRLIKQKSYAYRSYFSTVEKFREKEKELSESKKMKHSFVDQFYEKLKKQLQNNLDSKKLKENLSLMNICLNHKHARNASQNLNDLVRRKKPNLTQRLQRTALNTKRQLPLQEPEFKKAIHLKTRRIINSCQKENEDLNCVHKKIGLFHYYNKKMDQKFNQSEKKIKKAIREF